MTEAAILDQRAVERIVAHLKRWDRGQVSKSTFPATWAEVDALCRTVKHLRARIQLLESQWCECGHTKDRHGFFSDHDECYECNQASPDLCCEWRPVARPGTQLIELQSQLEQLRAENGALRESLAAEIAKRVNTNVERMEQSQKVSQSEIRRTFDDRLPDTQRGWYE